MSPVQVVPSTFAGLLHCPVLGSQVPTSWHWSLAVHVTAVWTQVLLPRSHESIVQGFLSSHWPSLVQQSPIGLRPQTPLVHVAVLHVALGQVDASQH